MKKFRKKLKKFRKNFEIENPKIKKSKNPKIQNRRRQFPELTTTSAPVAPRGGSIQKQW